MKKQGIISVIIPAYNAEKYIEKCLNSVIAQTYVALEIIVIDDGSKDSTLNIANEIAAKDNRIKVICQKNMGLPSARNTGLCNAMGEYILFLDSDDWLDEICCEIAVSELFRNNADIVFFDYYKEYQNKTIEHHSYKKGKIIYDEKNRKEVSLYDMRTITAWGKVYTKQCIGTTLYDDKMRTAEDVDFNYRVYRGVRKAVFLDKCLLHYRILEKSAIHGYDPKIEEKFCYPLNTVRNYTVGYGVEEEKAYYSFAAISYIVIAQNGIGLNVNITNNQKIRLLRVLNKSEWVRDLFNNMEKINIPFSRKLLILFGRYHFHFGVLAAITIKQRMEK